MDFTEAADSAENSSTSILSNTSFLLLNILTLVTIHRLSVTTLVMTPHARTQV